MSAANFDILSTTVTNNVESVIALVRAVLERKRRTEAQSFDAPFSRKSGRREFSDARGALAPADLKYLLDEKLHGCRALCECSGQRRGDELRRQCNEQALQCGRPKIHNGITAMKAYGKVAKPKKQQRPGASQIIAGGVARAHVILID